MPNPILVADTMALAHALDALDPSPRVALDSEGNGMHAYRTDLCVVQLCQARDDAPADDVFIVDTLAISDLAALSRFLATHAVVIHDLAFDARLLAARGAEPRDVVDTAVHARFLGLAETGLMKLLASRQGVTITKAFQHDDWARRPITHEQLEYLAADVAYLGPLAAGLEADALAAGIVDEIAEETAYALEGALRPESDEPGYVRIKGARALPPIARAVLRELWLARESIAESLDTPSGRVLSNAGIVALAKRRPAHADEVVRLAGLDRRAAGNANTFVAAIVRGESEGDVPADERAHFARDALDRSEFERRRERETKLSAWRQHESKARGVDLQVVLPGHVLADVVRLRPRSIDDLAAVPGFGTCRIERYADAILAVLDEADAASTKP